MKNRWNQCKVVSNPKPLDQQKVVIIRHANSTFNLAQKDLNYKGDPNYDYSLIDAPLSHIGLQQCQDQGGNAAANAMPNL